jgi:hypothetical protein
MKQEDGDLVGFLHDFTGACILFEFANDFDLANHRVNAHKSTGSTASFKTHGNCMVNLSVFNRQWRSFSN